MGKLLKYEIRKTMAVKLVILGVTALLELLFLIGIWTDNENNIGAGAALLFLTAFAGTLIAGLASVIILHRDMNTKQSYMLFMTPNSCYRILGAKVLENGISILLMGAGFFALGALDITVLFAKEGRLSTLWETFQRVMSTMDSRLVLDGPMLAAFTLNLLMTWFAAVTAAYLSEVISAALLNGRRMNGLLSFALFILLLIFEAWLENLAGGPIRDLMTSSLTRSAVALVCSAGMYFLTAQIMERRLSV